MKFLSAALILVSVLILAPNPAEAGGHSYGWAIGGAFLGGFVLGNISGGPSVYPLYPSYGYYPPPVYYQPPPVWIPGHYELRWGTICPQWNYCYQAQVPVIVPGHWEYR